MRATLIEKVRIASEKDAELLCSRDQLESVLGHNPDYLLEVHGITKNELIRLERKGLAFKAKYEVAHPKTAVWDRIDAKIQEHNSKMENAPLPLVPRKNGTHRVRWIIFREVLDA